MNELTAEELIIKASFGKINVKIWLPENSLSKIPIVLLHDSLGSVDLWRGFPEKLAENLSCPVIAYDRFGFGNSDARKDEPSFQFIEEEASIYFPEIKSGLSLSEYILLGHSVGGPMSINIAVQDQDCKGVVTIAAQSYVEEVTLTEVEKTRVEFQKHGQMDRLKKWHGDKAQWVLDAWTDKWASKEFSSWSLEACMGKVICPILAIHGRNDVYGSTALAENMVKMTKGFSEMLVLKDCGHIPHLEKTEEVVYAIKEFINVNCLR